MSNLKMHKEHFVIACWRPTAWRRVTLLRALFSAHQSQTVSVQYIHQPDGFQTATRGRLQSTPSMSKRICVCKHTIPPRLTSQTPVCSALLYHTVPLFRAKCERALSPAGACDHLPLSHRILALCL